ncbi:hypothetical protein PIB30_008644 [Stylosanthes scabra]|uniref:Uncharacterized protein n=1 Tax=Stylosanthes scabra TaxID=79078 RepID=A0ABU6S512_9FABA|nr:hypothetical protein [Stylosanthes scabra]
MEEIGGAVRGVSLQRMEFHRTPNETCFGVAKITGIGKKEECGGYRYCNARRVFDFDGWSKGKSTGGKWKQQMEMRIGNGNGGETNNMIEKKSSLSAQRIRNVSNPGPLDFETKLATAWTEGDLRFLLFFNLLMINGNSERKELEKGM